MQYGSCFSANFYRQFVKGTFATKPANLIKKMRFQWTEIFGRSKVGLLASNTTFSPSFQKGNIRLTDIKHFKVSNPGSHRPKWPQTSGDKTPKKRRKSLQHSVLHSTFFPHRGSKRIEQKSILQTCLTRG